RCRLRCCISLEIQTPNMPRQPLLAGEHNPRNIHDWQLTRSFRDASLWYPRQLPLILWACSPSGEISIRHAPGFLANVNDAKRRVKECNFRELKQPLDAG